MLRWILGSVVLSEAVIGLVLTGLLLLGKADQAIVVDVTSFIGFLVFACGLLPLLAKIRKNTLYQEKDTQHEGPPVPRLPYRSRLCAYVLKHSSMLRAMLVGAIVFGNGLALFYLTMDF